ncbi:hypothetical protein A2U01_0117281, partial [Trifolium medium]|nr:hypothetical protein [Trifolium medium]
VQREDETLRSYLERFNKAAVEMKTEESMKLYLLEEIKTLDAFFEKA